jgi:hypothetical protein
VEDQHMKKKITLYSLYEIDTYGRTRFAGRFASLQKLKAAALFLPGYFYEAETKQDEFA